MENIERTKDLKNYISNGTWETRMLMKYILEIKKIDIVSYKSYHEYAQKLHYSSYVSAY